MTLGNYNLTPIWLKISQYQNQINSVVIIALSVYLVAFTAQMTWRIVPSNSAEPQETFNTKSNISSVSSSPKASLQKIRQLYLFGKPNTEAPPVEEVVVQDAPETNLNLTLTGSVTSSEEDGGAAIIDNKGTQNTYGVGEKIDGTNALVNQVLADRIIIKNGNRLETLMLDGFDFDEQNTRVKREVPTSRPVSTTKTTRRSQKISRETRQAAQEIKQNPKSFTEFISISPVRQNGQMLGFRTSPGRKSELFNQSGLKTNDIITEINGLDVTDVRQSVEAMQALRSSELLEVTLIRGEEPITLSIDLNGQSEDIDK